MTPIVELNDVVVRRGRRPVLGPLSLTVAPGDFLGVVGPNGAGKSTLLMTLAARLPIASGRFALFGAAMDGRVWSDRAQIRHRVGVLFQRHDFIPELPFTVEDIVLLGRAGAPGLGRPYRVADRAAARQAMASLGLGDMRRRLYRELSGGERQKAQLARLLAQEVDLLLLDEPAAGLDLDWQERLTALAGELCLARGKTVAMVTHDVARLPACCQRALLLKDGRVLAQGAPADVFRSALLSELYGCAVEVAVRDGRYHVFSLRASNPAPEEALAYARATASAEAQR